LVIQNEDILDLLYGPYGKYGNIKITNIHGVFDTSEKENYDHNYVKHFIDGVSLQILKKASTWDEMVDNTFIIESRYSELLTDISSIISLLK
jgi:hypothetical protein